MIFDCLSEVETNERISPCRLSEEVNRVGYGQMSFPGDTYSNVTTE